MPVQETTTTTTTTWLPCICYTIDPGFEPTSVNYIDCLGEAKSLYVETLINLCVREITNPGSATVTTNNDLCIGENCPPTTTTTTTAALDCTIIGTVVEKYCDIEGTGVVIEDTTTTTTTTTIPL